MKVDYFHVFITFINLAGIPAYKLSGLFSLSKSTALAAKMDLGGKMVPEVIVQLAATQLPSHIKIGLPIEGPKRKEPLLKV